MKHVDSYISTLEMDVVTAAYLVIGLNSSKGMRGAAAELFDVKESHENISEWKRVKGLYESKGGSPIWASTTLCITPMIRTNWHRFRRGRTRIPL